MLSKCTFEVSELLATQYVFDNYGRNTTGKRENSGCGCGQTHDRPSNICQVLP